jgi:uncharacterized integral membrane protein
MCGAQPVIRIATPVVHAGYNSGYNGYELEVPPPEAPAPTGAHMPDVDEGPVPGAPLSVADAGRGGREDGARHNRISGAWVAVAVAVVLGIALIDFIVQNTRSVRIEFFGASGHMPVAVALLGAALAGAVVVLTISVSRSTHLRMAARRSRKRRFRLSQRRTSSDT